MKEYLIAFLKLFFPELDENDKKHILTVILMLLPMLIVLTLMSIFP